MSASLIQKTDEILRQLDGLIAQLRSLVSEQETSMNTLGDPESGDSSYSAEVVAENQRYIRIRQMVG